jgi:hypothetical protein
MDIAGYTQYTINKNGEIYSKKKKKNMKQWLDRYGYYMTGLTINKKQKHLLVHRLIYQAFILKNSEIMPEFIDHKNGIRTDNSLDNLRCCTKQENGRNRGKTREDNIIGHKNIRKKENNAFQVVIILGLGRKTYYKTFKTLEEAIADRDIKLTELHGEFANNGS